MSQAGANNNTGGGGISYFSLTPYIVGTDIHSQYATIGAAITAAVADGASSTAPANIYIKPQNGGYTENLTLSDGLNLVGFNRAVKIIGKITMTTAGTATISGLNLQTNGDYVIEVTGAAAITLNILNCNLSVTNANGVHYTNSSATLNLSNSTGDCGANTFFICTGGAISVFDSQLASGANTTVASTFVNCFPDFRSSYTNFPITTSGTSTLSVDHCSLFASDTTILTHGGSGSAICSNSRLESGTASTISIGAGATLPVMNCALSSSNTNVLTGAGILKYGLIVFYGSSSGHNVTTETPLATLI